ncbi:sugar transferase [Sanguibacter sp. A247]|uniref:sugar transferase n=1 Tax=unclassified Sanguibacter TaxID=2645534 RepID=UPI003FD8119D
MAHQVGTSFLGGRRLVGDHDVRRFFESVAIKPVRDFVAGDRAGGTPWVAQRATRRRLLPSIPWTGRYSSLVGMLDVMAIVAAAAVAVRPWAGGDLLGRTVVALLVSFLWVGGLMVDKTRDRRIVGIGLEEYARVWRASWRVAAAFGLGAFLAGVPVDRWVVVLLMVVGLPLVLLARYGARTYLRSLRDEGRALSRLVVAGSRRCVEELIDELNTNPRAGYLVVGACVPGGDPLRGESVAGVPVLGDVPDIPHQVKVVRAHAVAVAGADSLTAGVVRDLGYRLESTGTDLIVAPGLVDVAGPRVVLSPAEGLSLVHVDAPQFTGVRYVAKSALDRGLALVALLVLGLPMLLIALRVRTTSAGPVLYRQERVGRDGRPFKMLKFRSMRVGADAELDELAAANEAAGPLFKMRDDPRVTPTGAVLRRYSLDELPQLLNVLRGDMSLVGPRPPLPSEVAQYDGHAPRRMLVKPGLTGLWQVSGRSDLSWEEGLRKDIYYVENWSIVGDVLILARTFRAVFAHEGAY